MEKFIKPRLLTPSGQSHKKFWQAVGLCALTAAVFFLPFYILDGGFFHYAGDFNSQQISFYRYMNGFVKGAGYPDSAFAGAPRNTFSWATDLGSGVMNAYSFYLYGSPFFWLSVLLPQSWLPYMMVPLLVLKFGVAGGGAYLYLRRYVKNANYAVLGACLYALSGFAVYNVFFNHFVDVVALFPYLLWALDEAIYEDRHGLFAFWVAVNLLNNYFFFVGQVLFLCIYFVCKLSARDFRLTGRKFGHLLWESVLGVAMGCLLLFPAVLSLLQNPRTIDLSSGWGFLTYSKVQQYLAILLSWILPPDSPYLTSVWSEGVIKWTSMTAYLPLCSLAGAMAYWRSRKADSKKRIVAVCAVCALVPVLNSAFYALNSSYYARWYYMPTLILAAMTVNALEDPDVDLDAPARGIGWIMLATLVFAVVPVRDDTTETWSFGVLKNPGQFFVVLGFGLLGLMLYRVLCSRWRQDSRFAQSIRINLPRFTLVGATTRAGQITGPLRDRFGVLLKLELYSPDELSRIIMRSAGILDQPITPEGAYELAKCSRGTPRVANRFLKRIRDFATVLGDGIIDRDVALLGLKRMDVDALGLDELDRSLLRAIIEMYNGGPVGLETLAAALGEEDVTLEDLCEPYLMQMGFLTRTPRGRCATRLAYEHLGMKAPETGSAEENGQQSLF